MAYAAIVEARKDAEANQGSLIAAIRKAFEIMRDEEEREKNRAEAKEAKMCEMVRERSESRQRDYVTETLRKMIREDCIEAANLGLLTKSDVVDIVRREVAAWEFETKEMI
jgi:thiamine pyrophosphate-dependent acetolactate synthase large subunit-like protein